MACQYLDAETDTWVDVAWPGNTGYAVNRSRGVAAVL
jgi:hypothetical protein